MNAEDYSLKSNFKRGLARLLLVHGILTLHNLLQLMLVVPAFGAMFNDFGSRFPASTQFLCDVYKGAHASGMLLVPLAVATICLDAVIYTFISYRWGSRTAGIWFWTVTGILTVWPFFVIFAMYMPIWQVNHMIIINGAQPPPGN